MKYALIGFLMVLGACAGIPSLPTPTQQITAACNTYASTLNVLTAFALQGQLSAAQIAAVDSLTPVMDAICLTEGEFTDPVLVLDRLEEGLFEILLIKDSV